MLLIVDHKCLNQSFRWAAKTHNAQSLSDPIKHVVSPSLASARALPICAYLFVVSCLEKLFGNNRDMQFFMKSSPLLSNFGNSSIDFLPN